MIENSFNSNVENDRTVSVVEDNEMPCALKIASKISKKYLYLNSPTWNLDGISSTDVNSLGYTINY